MFRTLGEAQAVSDHDRNRAGRLEDQRLLTGKGRFVADIDQTGQLWMAVVRSPYGNALIRHIDGSLALRAPGVVAVHVAADLAADGLGCMPCGTTFPAVTPACRAAAPCADP